MAHRVTLNSDSNYVPIEGVKMEVQRFVQEIGFEIYFVYHEINHHKIKFWDKNTLVACYSRSLSTLEIC